MTIRSAVWSWFLFGVAMVAVLTLAIAAHAAPPANAPANGYYASYSAAYHAADRTNGQLAVLVCTPWCPRCPAAKARIAEMASIAAVCCLDGERDRAFPVAASALVESHGRAGKRKRFDVLL